MGDGTSGYQMHRRERPPIQIYTASAVADYQMPPAYSSITYNQETSMTTLASTSCVHENSQSMQAHLSQRQRRRTTTHFPIAHDQTSITTATPTSEKTPTASECHTMPRLPSTRQRSAQHMLTAQEVAQLLRPSTNLLSSAFQRNQDVRRNTMHIHHRSISTPNSNIASSNNHDCISARSVDDLVANAALIGESAAASGRI